MHIDGNIVNNEESFLKEKAFNVFQNKAVVSGGSEEPVLGLIIFLVYVDGFPDLLQGDVYQFREMFDDLQHGCQTALGWPLTWDLPLNENK